MTVRAVGRAWAALRAGMGPVSGALALFILVSCILEPTAKRGSEVENEVSGTLVTDLGDPASGARVIALPADGVLIKASTAGRAAAAETVVTDTAGRYRFIDLAPGDYNLLGDLDDGRLVALIQDVRAPDSRRLLDLGVDTLRAPGGIRARILLDGEGKVGVFCFVPGTSFIASSDDSGWCVLGTIPQGTYSLRYVLPGYVVVPDTGIRVQAGRVTELAPKELEHDPELPPPAPKNLRVAYDPRNGVATLTWSPVRVSDLAGYAVYLRMPGEIEPRLRSGLVTDTVFADTAPPLPGVTRTLVYQVKARDRNSDLSAVFSASATDTVMPAEWYAPRISWLHSPRSADSAVVGDTLVLVCGYRVEGRGVESIRWLAGDSLLAERTGLPGAGADTLKYPVRGSGNQAFTVVLTDAWGGGFRLQRDAVFLAARLTAAAGADTTVTIKDSVRLRGMGTGVATRLEPLEWDIGATGSFLPYRDGVAAFTAPDTAGEIRCILRVRGSGGEAALDTAIVRVKLDPPVADAGPDRRATQDALVTMAGSAMDSLGRIVRYEWLAHGDSLFREAGARLVVDMSGRYDTLLMYVLRVTDDDGNTASDTAFVRLDFDPIRASAGPDLRVTIRDTVQLRPSAAGAPVAWEWDIGGKGTYQTAPRGLLAFVAPDTAVDLPCILRVTDPRGQTAFDTVFVSVRLDPPTVSLGPDWSVSINDTVRAAITAGDGAGRIVSVAWDLGDGFIPGPDHIRFQAPAEPRDSLRVIAKVADDDGLEARDTLVIRVDMDPPVAAFAQRFGIYAFPGDSIRFTAAGSRDGHGAIVRYEWDWKGDGSYVDLGREAVIPSSGEDAGRSLRLRLRVTDDDGLTDTVSVGYNLAPAGEGWASVYLGPAIFKRGQFQGAAAVFNGNLFHIGGHGTGRSNSDFVIMDAWGERKGGGSELPIGDRMGHALLAHAGKLWVLGGGRGNLSVWNTADGLDWSRVADSVPFGSRSGFAAYVFQGRMWVAGGQMDVHPWTYFNDVWSSADGKTWVLETSHAAFTPRTQSGTFQFDGKLWLTSGVDNHSSLTDIWSSANGRDWNLVGSLPAQGLHQHVVHGGKIWTLLPYVSGAGAGPRLLTSTNGIEWTEVDDSGTFRMGHGFSAVEFAGHIWAVGPLDSETSTAGEVLTFRVIR